MEMRKSENGFKKGLKRGVRASRLVNKGSDYRQSTFIGYGKQP